MQKKIPANSKEIAVARSYGDLRENHEYKAAKEMQKILMRRKEELETQLARARGTDFSNAAATAMNAVKQSKYISRAGGGTHHSGVNHQEGR